MMPLNVQFCTALSKWKCAYIERYTDIKRKNDVLYAGILTEWHIVINTSNRFREIASRQGFPIRDLLNGTSFGALYNLRNRCFQEITLNG